MEHKGLQIISSYLTNIFITSSIIRGSISPITLRMVYLSPTLIMGKLGLSENLQEKVLQCQVTRPGEAVRQRDQEVCHTIAVKLLQSYVPYVDPSRSHSGFTVSTVLASLSKDFNTITPLAQIPHQIATFYGRICFSWVRLLLPQSRYFRQFRKFITWKLHRYI